MIQSDADLETGKPGLWIWGTGFSTAQGRAVRENDVTVWMFDNEIDWVIAHRALVPRTGCREAAGRTSAAMTRIQGRAHCRVVASDCHGECKCSNVRRVSLGVQLESCVSIASCSQAKLSRLSLIRTEVIQLPALELILWSSY